MSFFNRPTTSTPATPSLFGTSQPQQGASPFAPPTAPAASTGGGLFGASTPSVSTPSAPSGGLFGAPQAPAASTGTTLFSTPAATSAPATGGLFGTASTPASAAGGGGGLFGTASTAAPASNTGGLFGGAAAATSSTGGGLLGQPAVAPTAGGGLFGSGASTQQKPPLFSPTGQPATGSTLNTGFSLGSSTVPKPGGLFTATTPGGQQQQSQQQQQQQQQQQNTVPAATIDITRLTPTTRFGDCHESVQQELEQLDKHIQSQIATAEALSALFPSHRQTVSTIPSDTSVLAHKLSTTKSFLSADQISLSHAQKHHQADNEAATLSIRCLDLFRLPPAQRSQYFQRADNTTRGGDNEVTSNAPMIAYFNKHAESMEKALRIFLESVGEVEASLRSVEQSAAVGGSGVGVNGEDLTAVTGGVGGRQDARRLNRTLREFNDALRDVSGRIVDVKDGLRELRSGGRR